MTEEIERLKELRQKFGVPRDYIAFKLGTNLFTVYRWEKGIVKPSPVYRRQLRRLLRNFPGGDI